jgi:membrane AbrB-like protein
MKRLFNQFIPQRHPPIFLIVVSLIFVAALQALQLPAAILIGCMCGAIVLAVGEAKVNIPRSLFLAAQSVVGCLIARSMQPAIAFEIIKDWPVFLIVVFSVIATSGALGWLLMRSRVLPGTTAVWGLAPGAATAMVLMADAYGADTRLVAFMQYLRVLLVTVVASAVTRLWVTTPAESIAVAPWFPPVAWNALAATLLVALVGIAAARRYRIPSGSMVIPMMLGVILQGVGVLTIELPPALLAISYAIIGWSIGLRFTRPILAHAARALPRVLASILALIAICAGFAALLTRFAGVDPLTAYLATSPGGADSVAIIAASSPVDVPFVMAMQIARFFTVLLVGPPFSRFIARRYKAGLP